MTNKFLVVVTALVLIFGVFYGVYQYAFSRGYEKRQSEEQPYEITEFDKQQIIQQARLSWYPQSVIDSILRTGKSKINWSTQINWIDSLNIRDSIRIKEFAFSGKFPVYEADTILTSSKTDEYGNEVNIKTYLLQRFFPQYEVFASDFQIKSVNFSIVPSPAVSYTSKAVGIYGGVKNKFDKEFYGYIGGEFYIIDKSWFILSVGGEGNYNINNKLWDGETKFESKIRF